MTRPINFTNKRPASRDSYQTPNYANLIPQNPLHVNVQLQPTFVNAFHQNLKIDPLDPDQTIATPEELPPNAITAARVLLAGLSGQEASQIDFYAEEPSEEQVIEAIQHISAATDLVRRRKPPKHNNPPAQPTLTFDQVLADLETKLLQQYKLLQGTLTQIHIQHDLQGEHDASANGYCRVREPTEDVTVTSNTSSIQQPNAEVTTGIVQDRWSTSSLCRYVINENCRFYRRTGLGTEEADRAVSHRHDQKQARDNATRMGAGSNQKTDTRNPTDCVFTTTESIITVEPESIRTTETILQPTSSIVDIGIVTTTIPLTILRTANAIPNSTSSVPDYPTIKSILPTVNPSQTQTSEPRLPNNEIRREQQSSSQLSQQMEQSATQTVERSRQSATSIRSIRNMLIPPIPAYPQQQTPRTPLLPYTTERNQLQRQSQRSISPPHRRADESDDDEFLVEIIPEMKMPHLPLYISDIETEQRTWQNRGYDLVRDPSVIKYKNSKLHITLATRKPTTFRDCREFWLDASFLLEQINIPHYLSKVYKSQSPHEKSK
ncbi:MAG: hypothetical protein EZS28_018959 [Streblomastix strix]|uniref:Uncharacterized protein n=1 Tax=Streblomastix strix TaxID=222440 RepID=A0A5J4VSF8_9EUKA|nr:MAG: hypothetical protein EZS28_018959 [Streblomastix strix]